MNAAERPRETALTQQQAQEIAALWQALEQTPQTYDLFALLRRIEALHPHLPRLGRAKRPSQEPLRIGQEPALYFAPSAIARLEPPRLKGGPKLVIHSFGLFGPNGPLPLVMTEYAYERAIHHGDHTLVNFADIFHHRLALLFYRAWADAQSTVSLDRPQDEKFTRHAASTIAYGLSATRHRDSVPDHARLNHAGHLVRQTRNAEGLARILANFFRVPAAIEEFVGRWLPLPRDQRSALGANRGSCLGVDLVAGNAVWDRQHRFRIRLGPMPRASYEDLLPVGTGHNQVLDWVRTYIGIELDWDLRLVLRRVDVPQARLGGDTRLGWTTWLGRGLPRDRDDLVLDPERIRRERTAPAASAA
ncbi:MAG: type VI secretion system baseplate subunit TssG [Rhodanobacteraceae bacterium]|nr:type VI secretion system baseplate subunit TssG [Rhodanobacteraceae bacterium]